MSLTATKSHAQQIFSFASNQVVGNVQQTFDLGTITIVVRETTPLVGITTGYGFFAATNAALRILIVTRFYDANNTLVLATTAGGDATSVAGISNGGFVTATDNYNFATLPAGTYTVNFELTGIANFGAPWQARATAAIIAAESISPRLQTALDAITTAQEAGDTALANQLTQVANDLAAVENQITTINTEIATLQASNTTQDGQITSLQRDLDSANSSILDLNNSVTSLKSQITTGNTDPLTGNATTLTQLEEKLKAAQSQQAEINSQLEKRISSLRSRLSSTETISQVGLGLGSAGTALGVYDLFSGSSFGPSTPQQGTRSGPKSGAPLIRSNSTAPARSSGPVARK